MSINDFRVNADQAATRGYGGEVIQRVGLTGPSIDASGRIRVGEPYGVFESKQIYDIDPNVFHVITSGVGASNTHLPNEAASKLQVGTASGEYVINQTSRYYNYIPGKSNLVVLTGVLGESKDNVTKRIGYYDNNDGLYFEKANSSLRVVRRTSTSGSVVNNIYEQADWNLDTLDGSGDANNPSGINIDVSKTQVFIIDFQWLGVDIIRYGFKINGDVIYCHEFLGANVLDVVYMATPDLPVRYEIINTGESASATYMKRICCSISSEAGYTLPGYEYSIGNGFPLRAITTRTPILAIRPLATYKGKTNRRVSKLLFSKMIAQTNPVYYELVHIHDPSGITATWNDVNSNESSVEFSTNISAVTGNPTHVIDTGYVAVGVPGQGGSVVQAAADIISRHTYMHQNYAADNPQLFVIYATPQSGTANVGATFNWIEFN